MEKEYTLTINVLRFVFLHQLSSTRLFFRANNNKGVEILGRIN